MSNYTIEVPPEATEVTLSFKVVLSKIGKPILSFRYKGEDVTFEFPYWKCDGKYYNHLCEVIAAIEKPKYKVRDAIDAQYQDKLEDYLSQFPDLSIEEIWTLLKSVRESDEATVCCMYANTLEENLPSIVEMIRGYDCSRDAKVRYLTKITEAIAKGQTIKFVDCPCDMDEMIRLSFRPNGEFSDYLHSHPNLDKEGVWRLLCGCSCLRESIVCSVYKQIIADNLHWFLNVLGKSGLNNEAVVHLTYHLVRSAECVK